MEISFCELRAKEVVNICDGRRLGNIVDLVLETCNARVIGIVVPGERPFFSFFRNTPDIFIPFNKIRKIGRDVILIELNPANLPVGMLQTETAQKEDLQEETKIENTYPLDSAII